MGDSVEYKTLRIYISSTDQYKFKPLYETIVFEAKRYGMAGATVLKGIMGYGPSSNVSSTKLIEIVEKLPLVVEIVDDAAKIDKFFNTIQPYFDKIESGCIVTMEKVNVVLYKTGTKKKGLFHW